MCLEHGAQTAQRIQGAEAKVSCTLVPLSYAKCNKLAQSWWQNICCDCIHVNQAKNTFSDHSIPREVRKEFPAFFFFFFTINIPRIQKPGIGCLKRAEGTHYALLCQGGSQVVINSPTTWRGLFRRLKALLSRDHSSPFSKRIS